MAQIEGGKSGARQTNIELNLVPFIDLMSVLITFLLITAVWTQTSMIQLGTSIYGRRSEDQAIVVPPDVDKVVKLDVNTQGFALTVGRQMVRIGKVNNAYDTETLLGHLKKARELFPDKLDAVISVSDELPYEVLILGMDVMLQSGFVQVAVATGGPG